MEGLPVPPADALLRDLPAAAAYLGVDIADPSRLADLTAVAIVAQVLNEGFHSVETSAA
jgi:hypothetical protein